MDNPETVRRHGAGTASPSQGGASVGSGDARIESDLLAALRPTDRALVARALEAVTLQSGDVIYNAGDTVSHCYFPVGAAMCAHFVELSEGLAVETFLVGREGALGGIVSSGNLPAYARASVLHGGTFLRIPLAELDILKSQSSGIDHLFARYADCVVAQVFQSIGCNAVHTIEQRAAKWLSAAVDRIGRNDVTITQEQLASMMGIGRSYASRVLQRFKREGILRTRRGGIVVLEPGRLEDHACDCNQRVAAHFKRVLGDVYLRSV